MKQQAMFMAALALVVTGPGCAAQDQDSEEKGIVDQSTPPAAKPGAMLSVAEAEGGHLVAISVESPHPYRNDMDELYAIDLGGLVGRCAQRARIHFAAIQTEAGYDFVTVEDSGESFDGNHTDVWSQWIELASATSTLHVRLDSDSSITRHGFAIDALEWSGSPICPALGWPPCAEGTVDITPPRGECSCPAQPVCVPVSDVELSHGTRRGFLIEGELVRGTAAYRLGSGPADEQVETFIGTIAEAELGALMRQAAQAGLLGQSGYQRLGETIEWLTIRAGETEVTFVAAPGEHDAQVAAVIAAMDRLTSCGEGEPLSCTDGYTCTDGACVAEPVCICTREYMPVCGIDGRTYGNACMAGCQDIAVAHPGECGIAGDSCGGFAGSICADRHKCRYGESAYEMPYPDASGACVAEDYCDAAEDCGNLDHAAEAGSWACEANVCSWQSGWQPVPTSAWRRANK